MGWGKEHIYGNIFIVQDVTSELGAGLNGQCDISFFKSFSLLSSET